MSSSWPIIAVLCVGTAAMKAAGPVMLRRGRPPDRVLDTIALVAPALLGALIVYQTFVAPPSGIAIDARLVGLAAAAVGVWLRLSILAVVAVAAASTAVARALT